MRSTAQKPVTAPISIIPSTPRLRTPERPPAALRVRRRAAASRTGSRRRSPRRRGCCSPCESHPVTHEELAAERAEEDQSLHDADETCREVGALQREAGVLQATEEQSHEHDRKRVVARERSDDDARVPGVRSAQAARIELVAEVAGLTRAAETRDRARKAHDRQDLASRAHSRIPAGTG